MRFQRKKIKQRSQVSSIQKLLQKQNKETLNQILKNYNYKHMELLQSVITNSYPSTAQLLKYWLTQLANITINLLLTYPINAIVCVIFIFIIVYTLICKFFGNQLFRAKYKPLQHRQNFVNQVRSLKKQIRQIQSEIIQMKKKITLSKKQSQVFQQNQVKVQQKSGYNSKGQKLTDKQQKIYTLAKLKIRQGKQSLSFNEKLQFSLKQSSQEIIKSLKQINERP